jgi:S1-C subfamily serine protease
MDTAVIAGVVSGGPADRDSLAAGDRIVAIDGRKITPSTPISSLVLVKKPGDQIAVTDADGLGTHAAAVTLGSGPAQ